MQTDTPLSPVWTSPRFPVRVLNIGLKKESRLNDCTVLPSSIKLVAEGFFTVVEVHCFLTALPNQQFVKKKLSSILERVLLARHHGFAEIVGAIYEAGISKPYIVLCSAVSTVSHLSKRGHRTSWGKTRYRMYQDTRGGFLAEKQRTLLISDTKQTIANH